MKAARAAATTTTKSNELFLEGEKTASNMSLKYMCKEPSKEYLVKTQDKGREAYVSIFELRHFPVPCIVLVDKLISQDYLLMSTTTIVLLPAVSSPLEVDLWQLDKDHRSF